MTDREKHFRAILGSISSGQSERFNENDSHYTIWIRHVGAS